jgi:cystathionine beta-lyase/cystathionine gamma-synthase
MPQSLAEYAQLHLSLGEETAFVTRRGFRTLRWSYRQMAELAFRVARELESRPRHALGRQLR